MMKTKQGELSVHVEDWRILCKAIRSPPQDYYGLEDQETKYRQRYLDLMVNEDTKERFRTRTKIIRHIQRFLDDRGFLEVETPALQPVYGGANARPFTTELNSLDMDMYLRISDELYLKRLIIGGFDKVYEICKDFRNEGVDTSHNPEFTMVEWYEAYEDYYRGMELVETLVSELAEKITGDMEIRYQGERIDLTPPWRRITMRDAIEEWTGYDVRDHTTEELRERVANVGGDADGSRGELIAELFEETVEDEIVQPTFVTEHPVETTPLCKEDRNEEGFVERFEPFIAGMEIGNAYSELNDPERQRELFERQQGGEESHPIDTDFVEALEYGMPPTSGVGLGVDRLVMLLTDAQSIRDVILFPTLKPKKD